MIIPLSKKYETFVAFQQYHMTFSLTCKLEICERPNERKSILNEEETTVQLVFERWFSILDHLFWYYFKLPIDPKNVNYLDENSIKRYPQWCIQLHK